MKRFASSLALLCSLLLIFGVVSRVMGSERFVQAQQALFIAYPPSNHQTTASKIFLIGTAPNGGEVLVNGKAIARNSAGHFAPSFPLQIGANPFTVRYRNQELQLTITRQATGLQTPTGSGFARDSLSPAVNIGRLPNEWICFAAAAPQGATVAVRLGSQTIPLQSQPQSVELPPNSAVLTQQNQPAAVPTAGYYRGCTRTAVPGDLGQPTFELTLNNQSDRQLAPGSVQILSPTQLEVAEVTAEAGVARTGPSTDYSRLTPLPRGTQASITGYEGDWVRLDYGAWMKRSEVQVRRSTAPPTSLIRSVKARRAGDWIEIVFPLQVPVPVSVQQAERTFTLTLHNTTAQTDTINLDDDPLIARLDWQQTQPGQVQYVFNLKTSQQWGYTLRYEGTSLVLALKHPPKGRWRSRGGGGDRGALSSSSPSSPSSPSPQKPLTDITILLDPGHGGPEDLGSRGPTGYPEKDVALTISKLVRDELTQRGATVVMTREKDADVGLQERVNLISKTQPAIALSLHYNALPDDGDAINTKGVSTFWYHAQAHSLAVSLHNYLVKTLKRSSYGVFWNNLALTRPSVTPSVLLELGFMINPDEYEWIINPTEQKRLARAIADGITQWFRG
ncbi:MAG: N-acetylmuramoyl-L-alanine amidase [Leptolyngbyaceae cyanobacterium RU_5_1]|nr:N-acetylmuramoyl-L-alanine amidase [Leptolyngbyaceae cyanobacterium RU_5_1]